MWLKRRNMTEERQAPASEWQRQAGVCSELPDTDSAATFPESLPEGAARVFEIRGMAFGAKSNSVGLCVGKTTQSSGETTPTSRVCRDLKTLPPRHQSGYSSKPGRSPGCVAGWNNARNVQAGRVEAFREGRWLPVDLRSPLHRPVGLAGGAVTAYLRHRVGEAPSLQPMGPKLPDHPSVGWQCPVCFGTLEAGDYTTLIPLGPGDDEEECRKAREGQWFTAVAIETHYTCATGSKQLGETQARRSRHDLSSRRSFVDL